MTDSLIAYGGLGLGAVGTILGIVNLVRQHLRDRRLDRAASAMARRDVAHELVLAIDDTVDASAAMHLWLPDADVRAPSWALQEQADRFNALWARYKYRFPPASGTASDAQLRALVAAFNEALVWAGLSSFVDRTSLLAAMSDRSGPDEKKAAYDSYRASITDLDAAVKSTARKLRSNLCREGGLADFGDSDDEAE